MFPRCSTEKQEEEVAGVDDECPRTYRKGETRSLSGGRTPTTMGAGGRGQLDYRLVAARCEESKPADTTFVVSHRANRTYDVLPQMDG